MRMLQTANNISTLSYISTSLQNLIKIKLELKYYWFALPKIVFLPENLWIFVWSEHPEILRVSRATIFLR